MTVHDDVLAAVADAHGIDPTDRRAAWRGRLAEDQVFLDLLQQAPVPEGAAMVRLHDLVPPREGTVSAVRDRSPYAPSATADEPPSWCAWAGEPAAVRVERAIEAIEAGSHLNAFTAVFADEARAVAADIDRRREAGERVGPLAGCLVAVKDLIDVRGYRTTGGSRALVTQPAVDDAPAVARLRAAGAIVLGMANLHALAYGALSTSSDAGVVGNPLRPDAIAGGSSGGSAAAVRAGMVDLALGTDTAGSIRIPSSVCGVVGVKPTYGLVPTAGVQALGPSLDHVGPIAPTVAAAALALQVLADQPVGVPASTDRSLDGVVVGLPRQYFTDHLDPEVRDALDAAVAVLPRLGAQVRQVDLPTVRYAPGAQLCTMSSEAFDVHRELLQARPEQLPPDVRLRLEVGMFRSAPDYVRAQRLRAVLQAEMAGALEEVDVLLTPTLPVTAPRRDVRTLEVDGAQWTTQFAVTRLTMPFNLTGFPALTLPWSADGAGGSIGLQLAAAPLAEAMLFRVAQAVEEVSGLQA